MELFAASRHRSDLISEEDYIYLTEAAIPFRFFICCLGMVTNTLCIKTYYKIGLENSVTLLFFVLAILDWFHLVASIPVILKDLLDILIRQGHIWIETFPIILVTTHIVPRTFVESACLVTTFLAIQRCMCVIYPLHFKEFFTRTRIYTVLVIIFLFCLTLHMAQIAQHEIIRIPVPSNNGTRLLIFFIPISLQLDDSLFLLFGVVINVSTQVILLLCVIIMATALKKSVRFRQGALASTTDQEGDPEKANVKEKKMTSSSILSNTKELQAITQVALVCTIYLLCNIPRCINAFAVTFIPAMDPYMPDNFVYLVFSNIVHSFEDLNSSINLFVYYKYNKAFRKALFNTKSQS